MARPSPKKSLEVNVTDGVKVSESIFNYKDWFNGLKKFVAIRLK